MIQRASRIGLYGCLFPCEDDMASRLIHQFRTGVKRLWRANSPTAPASSFPGTKNYWRQRYSVGGDSGPGSQNEIAEFKAEILNNFVLEHGVRSVIEFGCGDGQQLALYQFPTYIGLDVTTEAIQLCSHRFRDDLSKSFFLYESDGFVDNHKLFSAELAISIEVVFHLVEDQVFERYMRDLFGAAERFVIIFSSNDEGRISAPHVRHREFTRWIEENQPNWRIATKICNRYPYRPENGTGSFSDFFIFEQRGES